MGDEQQILISKLIEVRKHIGVMQKTLKGNRDALYVDPAVLLMKGTDKMNELGVFLTSNVLEATTNRVSNPTKTNKAAENFCVSLKMEMVFIDAETGATLVIPWFAIGTHATDPSMAGGGALTYFERYFFMKQFNIPTTKDDPEFLVEQVKGPEPLSEKQLAELQADVKAKITNLPGFLEYIGVGSLESIPARRFAEVKEILRLTKVPS